MKTTQEQRDSVKAALDVPEWVEFNSWHIAIIEALVRDADRLHRAEELLKEASFGFHQHKASLLDYCPRCRERVKAIDAFLGDEQ